MVGKVVVVVVVLMICYSDYITITTMAQDYSDYNNSPAPPPPPREEESCDGIFVSYVFLSREKEYPRVKNASAQAWAFKAIAKVLNAGTFELKAWKIFIGFQNDEILVSAGGAVVMDGDDMPAAVGNGTYLSGFPQADLKTSIQTAGDINQIQVQIPILGTQFGVKPPGVPMPRTISLENEEYRCPKPTLRSELLLLDSLILSFSFS